MQGIAEQDTVCTLVEQERFVLVVLTVSVELEAAALVADNALMEVVAEPRSDFAVKALL